MENLLNYSAEDDGPSPHDPSEEEPSDLEFSYEDVDDDDNESHDDLDNESHEDADYEAPRWNSWKAALRSRALRIGAKLRVAAVALADVDNVWDSPETAFRPASRDERASLAGDTQRRRTDGTIYGLANQSVNGYGSNNLAENFCRGDVDRAEARSTRNRTAVLFWFLLLSISYASERSTFKLLVDRVGPFRLFSAELMLGCHAGLLAFLLAIHQLLGRDAKGGKTAWDALVRPGNNTYSDNLTEGRIGLPIPLVDIGLMAILDTIYLLLGVISGAHVPPVLTVILVQTTIPLTACFTQCVHPDGHCTRYRSTTEENDGISSARSHSHQHAGNDHDHAQHLQTQHYPALSSAPRSEHTTNIRIISKTDINNIHTTVNTEYDISYVPNLPAPPPPPVKGWGGLSRYHMIGTGLIFLAILIGLTPAVLSLDHIVITKKDAIPDRTAYNTIVFCCICIFPAMSQLYKEQTLTKIRQPIDRNLMNMVISIFQLLFAVTVSPLAYGLQGMGDGPGWTTLYPSKQIGENFSHGLACFLGTLDEETMIHGYPERAICSKSWLLVLLHALSIIMVGVAIDKLAATTKVMYRGVSMGIMLAVMLMFVYQIRDQWSEYGILVSAFHLTSTFVLIVGAEIYHRVSLADATFETVYPEIGDLYEEDEG